MIKNIFLQTFVVALSLLALACSHDNDGPDYLPPAPAPSNTLDAWIQEHLSLPYNISVKYKQTSFSNSSRNNTVLADTIQAKSVLQAFIATSINPYVNAFGEDFVKQYFPKEIHLEGIANYNDLGVEQLSADFGSMILPIYNVNSFAQDEEQDIYDLSRKVNYFLALRLLEKQPTDLDVFATYNIQPYSTDWQSDISNITYVENTNVMVEFGFVSRAAQSNVYDDFAETFSLLVCRTQKDINTLLETAEAGRVGATAKVCLENKISFVNSYLSDKYGIRLSNTLSRNVPRAIKQYAQ